MPTVIGAYLAPGVPPHVLGGAHGAAREAGTDVLVPLICLLPAIAVGLLVRLAAVSFGSDTASPLTRFEPEHPARIVEQLRRDRRKERPAESRGARARRVLGLITLASLLWSCRPRAGAAPARPEPLTLVVALDGTRSYERLDEARRQLGEVLTHVPPGSDVVARWISRDSYAPSNAIVAGSLPEVDATAANPFDRRERRRRAAHLEAFAAARTELLRAIERAPSPRAGATDIFGFLAFASEVARRSHGRRVVVAIATDLRNNVHLYDHDVNADTLSSVDVILLAFAAPSPSARAEQERLLLSLGAARVRAISDGERVPADILEPRREAR